MYTLIIKTEFYNQNLLQEAIYQHFEKIAAERLAPLWQYSW